MRIPASSALLILVLARPAQAVSVQDIIELSRAGLGVEVLVALVETSDSVFTLEAAQILELKSAGVPERVILALVTKGRATQDPTRAPTSTTSQTPPVAPPVIVVRDDEEPCPPPVPVVVTVPVAFPVVVSGLSRSSGFSARPHVWADGIHRQPLASGVRRAGRFINDGFSVATTPTPLGEPAYWGWGGTLRPDAWGQPRGGRRTNGEAPPATAGSESRPRERREVPPR